MRGNRIQSIVNELQGEKIDVVRWDKDPAVLISNALSPSEVIHVDIDEKAGAAVAVVPERQLSLAIGKEGQNARLAAWLTGFRLDIKSMSEWETIKAQRQTEAEEAAKTAARTAVAQDGLEAEAELQVVEAEPVLAEAVVQEIEEAIAAVAEPVVEIEAPAEEAAPAAAEEAAIVVAEETDGRKLTAEEELALLALEEEEEEEEEELEEVGEDVWNVPAPVLSAGAGQIRFAEDIMGEFRGRGRRDRRGKGGGNASKGRRGPPGAGRARKSPSTPSTPSQS
jgi:N utilization substance protein A